MVSGKQIAPVIVALLVLVVIKGMLFAAALPAWEGDDETAYWADIRSVVGEPALFHGASPTTHGRLYPTLAAPIYRLTSTLPLNQRLFVVRLLGAAFLAGVVFFAYKGAKELWPDSTFCQVAAPMFVAFNPKLSFVMASASSDVLLIFMLSAFFYLITSFVIEPSGAKAALFVPVVVAGVLTKNRFLIALPLLALALLILSLRWLTKTKVFKKNRQKFLLGGAGAALLAWRLGPWAAEIIAGRSGAVGQAAATIDDKVLSMLGNGEFGPKMFRQFWGFFTWSGGIYLTESIYTVILALTVAAGAGLIVRAYRAGRWLAGAGEPADHKGSGFVLNIKPVGDERWRRVLALTLNLLAICQVVVATGAYEIYGASALGRYLLVGSVPFALVMAAGLDGLIPERLKNPSLLALGVGLFSLNILSITAFVMPRFY